MQPTAALAPRPVRQQASVRTARLHTRTPAKTGPYSPSWNGYSPPARRFAVLNMLTCTFLIRLSDIGWWWRWW